GVYNGLEHLLFLSSFSRAYGGHALASRALGLRFHLDQRDGATRRLDLLPRALTHLVGIDAYGPVKLAVTEYLQRHSGVAYQSHVKQRLRRQLAAGFDAAVVQLIEVHHVIASLPDVGEATLVGQLLVDRRLPTHEARG